MKIYDVTDWTTNIAILILPNISRSKGNLTIKFDNSIVYNMLNLFLEKLYTKCDRKATPRPFYRDTKFSISLDHQPEMLWSLFLLYVKSWSTNYTKIKVLIIWSRICRDELQHVQPGQISPYDYMGEPNFIQARRDSFPRGICINLFTFSCNFPL